MKKELKDYLHLYLGCECRMVISSYHAVHELHLSVKIPFVLTAKLLHYFIQPTTKSVIKPILRPLSDINKEEVGDLMGIKKAVIIKGNFSQPFFQIEYCYPTVAEVKYKHQYITQLSPEQFFILLSKNFDLFDLIESGLAIDATTLKENQ